MLNPAAISDDPAAAIEAAGTLAPYLAGLAHSIDGYGDPETLLSAAMHLCARVASGAEDASTALRLAKKQAHLAIAAGDLAGRFSLAQTTRHITEFADASLNAALASALATRQLSDTGLFAVALGKMGAFELNYSSDIDVAVFFDADLFADPAWDMLLDLTAAHAEGQQVSVTSLCIAAGVPATTALRWIKQLVETGVFERVADAADKRRAFIALSDKSVDAMARYFASIEAPLARAA